MSTGSGSQGQRHLVIVVGAGPAGMSVANLMSKAGHEVVILNRDIKFGGLAEYGIFPSKLKLRGGLRKTYWEIVERPHVHYFGNVSVGNGKDLTVDESRHQDDRGRRRFGYRRLSREGRRLSLQPLAGVQSAALRDGASRRSHRSR
jgi:NADPH-dependent glutamate synthase beta subunit-like oxidoreductase